MADRILVTGVNGFVGRHLARALADAKLEVDGVVRDEEVQAEIKPLVSKAIACDLVDEKQVDSIDFSGYRTIIHLAGLANVGQSFKDRDLYLKVNVQPLANIGSSLVRQKASPRIIAISTGAIYDNRQPMPLFETSKLAVASPYAESKIQMEKVAQQLTQNGLDCVIARPFNHIGPGQAPGFLVPDLVEQVRSTLENHGIMKVGNLTTKRDYTDVRDVVKAYVQLATAKLNHNVYNICSGKSRSGEEILKMITDTLAPGQKIKIQVDLSLVRPNDPKEIFGSFAQLSADTGWQPQIAIEQTIKDAVASA